MIVTVNEVKARDLVYHICLIRSHEALRVMARWPSGPRRVTQAKACLSQSGFSSAYAGRGSNPLLVSFFTYSHGSFAIK